MCIRDRYKVVNAAVGPPSSRDVHMAFDTGACIVCFGFSMPSTVQREAGQLGVATVQSKCVTCAQALIPLQTLVERLQGSLGLALTVNVYTV